MSETNYFPEFGGSTGGWLQAAETEETAETEAKKAQEITEYLKDIFQSRQYQKKREVQLSCYLLQ